MKFLTEQITDRIVNNSGLIGVTIAISIVSFILILGMGAYLYNMRKNMKKDKVALVKLYRQVFKEEATIKELAHNIPKLKSKAKKDRKQKELIKTLNSYSDQVTQA